MPSPNFAEYFHARELGKSAVIADLTNKIVLAPPFVPATYPSGPLGYAHIEPHNVTVVEAGAMHVFSSQGASKPRQWSLIISGAISSHPAAASNDRVVLIRNQLKAAQSAEPITVRLLADPAPSTPPAFEWGQTFKFRLPLLKRGSLERFRTLVHEWRQTRTETGSVLDMCTNGSYQRIIGMGQEAIPLILRELEQSTDEWFWALAAITGANPVPENHRGRRKLMVSDWLIWARIQGYQW